MKDVKDIKVMVSKAPTDPEQKKAWVSQMARIQFAMWVDDGASCEHCHHVYTSVDDMINANPRVGHTKEISFVCDGCYDEYKKTHPLHKRKDKNEDN